MTSLEFVSLLRAGGTIPILYSLECKIRELPGEISKNQMYSNSYLFSQAHSIFVIYRAMPHALRGWNKDIVCMWP